MNKFFIAISIILCSATAKAQQVSGYVTDINSGEVLIGAHIYPKNGKNATVTNSFGFFTLVVENGDSLVISYVGYNNKIIPILSTQKNPLQINLTASTNIDEVSVVAKKSIQELPEMGVISIPIQQIKSMPSLGGESDLMKTLQLMPGIRSTAEGQSSFVVRGGSPDQNLVILDNVPLYYVNHLGGFVSAFNSDAINNAKAYKGAFPARYGGRLSSIIKVDTKEGNLKKRQTSLTLGVITTKFLLEGPIKKDTLSYMVSVRRFMYDLITRPVTYLTENKKQSGYTFHDINAKVNYKPNQNNRLYLSLYSGRDKILSSRKDNEEDESYMSNTSKWGNLATSFRWNHIYGNKLFSNISAYYMQYKYSSEFEYSYTENKQKLTTISDFESYVNDIGINTDFEYYLHPNLNFKFGSNHIYHIYSPNNYYYSSPQFVADSTNTIIANTTRKSEAIENSLYLETEFTPSPFLSFNIGYRLSEFSTEEKQYLSQEPRLVLNLNIPKIFSIKGGYAKMSQNIHLLTYVGAGLPADLWMPSTASVPPQQSSIFSLGIYRSISNKNIEISIESYYKELSNLIEYKSGYNILSTSGDWIDAIEQNGKGESKGIEFLIQRIGGKVTGWVAYTLSKSTRQFENINFGKEYFSSNDATHEFSFVTNYNLKERLTLSTTWTYVSGKAITIPNEIYDTPVFRNNLNSKESPKVHYDYIGASYEQKNNVRMNPYHRLDLAITYRKYKKKSDRILSLGVYNAYNRQNANYYYVGSKSSNNGDNSGGGISRTVYQVSMFPAIPYISYTWKW